MSLYTDSGEFGELSSSERLCCDVWFCDR